MGMGRAHDSHGGVRAVALFVMLVAFANLERLKKQHDLATYREVLAFSRGEHVDRDTLAGQRAR